MIGRCFSRGVSALSLLLAIVAPAVCQTPARATVTEIADIAEMAVENGSRASGVFPGYMPPIKFAICDKDGLTVLASKRPMVENPTHQQRLTTSDTITLRLYSSLPADIPKRCFSFDYLIEEQRAVAFPVIDSIYSATGKSFATIYGLFHEAFHIHQSRMFAPNKHGPGFSALEEPPTIPDSIVEGAAFSLLAREERAMLVAALTAPTPDSMRSATRRYVSLRSKRFADVPEEYGWVEAQNERKEGVAHYVGYKTALMTLGRDTKIDSLIISDLNNAPAFRGGRGYRNWHIYATGAAICLLLDRLHQEWQQAVISGQPPIELLTAWSAKEY